MNKINRLNTQAENDVFLQVIINLNEDINSESKTLEYLDFYFQNPYEKYLFQTLIYNYIVSILIYTLDFQFE